MRHQSLQGLIQVLSRSSCSKRTSELSAQLSALISSASFSTRSDTAFSKVSRSSSTSFKLDRGCGDCLPTSLGSCNPDSNMGSVVNISAVSSRPGYAALSFASSHVSGVRARLASAAGTYPELQRSFHLSATCPISDGSSFAKAEGSVTEGEGSAGGPSLESQSSMGEDEGEPVIQRARSSRGGLTISTPSSEDGGADRDSVRSRSPFDGADWALGSDARGSSMIEKTREEELRVVVEEVVVEEEEGEGEAEEGGGEYVNPVTGEHGGPRGPEPTRYGDWERGGRCSDF